MVRLATVAACLLTTVGVAATAAVAVKPPAPSRAVALHAEGMNHPLIALRAGNQMLQDCLSRLRQQCTENQRSAAADGVWILRRLDTLTLFPDRMTRDASVPDASHEQLRERLRFISEEIVLSTMEYDQKLFARFGAALRVCPPEGNSYGDYLANMKHLDLRIFNALTAEEYAEALAAIEKEELALVGVLKQWPKADCDTAGEIGDSLLRVMYSKLQPWMKSKGPTGLDAAREADSDFLVPAAGEIERRFNPSMSAQWRVIREEREKLEAAGAKR